MKQESQNQSFEQLKLKRKSYSMEPKTRAIFGLSQTKSMSLHKNHFGPSEELSQSFKARKMP